MVAPEFTTSVGPVRKAAAVMSTLGIQNRFLKKFLGVGLIIFMSNYDVILHCFYIGTYISHSISIRLAAPVYAERYGQHATMS